jgi:phosphatidate cytidylyltransferase
VRDLIRRTATGISLVVLFVGSILLGPTPMLLMILLIYGLSIMELYKLLQIRKWVTDSLIAGSGALLIAVVYAGLHLNLSPLWLILPATLWIVAYTFGSGFTGVLTLFWLAIPFASFIALGWFPEGASFRPLIPVSVIALVWINDTFAYLAGSLLGRHPMTPRLSPKKTWEGFMGGLLISLVAGWLVFRLSGTFTPATWIIGASVISLLGLAGDLFESWLKRKYNVKDTGSLLPGHGGILDRFDSLLFVAPVLLVLLGLLNLL